MKRPRLPVPLLLLLVGAAVVLGDAGVVAQKTEEATAVQPEAGGAKTAELPPLERALQTAGENRAELERALAALDGPRRESLEFLIVNMPERDLGELSSRYLVENVEVAHDVMGKVSWAKDIPREIFLNDVLPYACVNERRDPWRRQFAERFLPLVADCSTAAEAAQRLNERLWGEVGVKYSTGRRKADQSPLESMESGLASCTGLSILLADACRAVGVPARLAGIPSWVNKRGNHTWVEIWDGEWHFTGACEPDPRGLNHTWFQNDASLAIKDSRRNAIYASSFARTGVSFPMVWARDVDYVSAVNVTDRYTAGGKPIEPAKSRLLVRVLERQTGARIAASVAVRASGDGAALVSGTSRDESADTNDLLSFDLERGRTYEIRVEHDGREARGGQKLEDDQHVVTLVLGETHVKARPTLPDAASTRLARAVDEYFRAPPEERSELEFDAELDRLLRDHESAVRDVVWKTYLASAIHAALAEDFKSDRVRSGEHESPYTVKKVGERPEGGWPVFIAMHGGGGVRKEVNDRQWRVMQSYYRDQDSVPGYLYLALRAPNDSWNGFYDDYVYPLIERLIRQFVVFGEVNPNKVFIMGYSHGGYGAFAIGPKIPDRFAAIHSSAAAPTDGESSPKTLRNTVFTYMIGETDLRYGRLSRCQAFDAAIKALRGDRTDIYPVTMEYQAGYGHGGLPDKDKIAAMYAAVRNPAPRELTWELTDGVVRSFFWLSVDEPGKKKEVRATVEDNALRVETENLSAVTVWLDQRLVDFDRPVTIDYAGETRERMLEPRLAVLCETLLARGDIDLAFTAKATLAPSATD